LTLSIRFLRSAGIEIVVRTTELIKPLFYRLAEQLSQKYTRVIY
jgi:hypothetical protein